MSIRGIDAQLMLSRTPDFARDASAQLKTGDKVQDFLAVQAQAEAEHEKSSVVKSEEAPKSELHLGDEGSLGQEYSGSGGSKKDKDKKKDDPLLDVNVGHGRESIIDIRL